MGGASVHYAAQSWRFHPYDFKLRSHTIERYGEAAIPQGSAIADWPISYEELEPYYDKVEVAIGVAGKAGVLRDKTNGQPSIEEGGNPFEAPRSREYPLPPPRMHRLGMLFHDATEKLGLHPFMGPLNINTEPYDGRPACTCCGFCMFFGCWNDAKGSTLVTTVPRALASGNVDSSTFSKAVKVEVDDRGEVAGINYLDANNNLQRISARTYILAAYTFENVRLSLLSKSRLFPNGLGNNRSLMGKYFLTHIYQNLAVIYDGVPLNRFAGSQGQRVVINDFNGDNFDHTGLGFIAGAQIFAHNEFHPYL